MTLSTTRAAVAASGLGVVHHVFAAKAVKPNDAMDPEVRVNAIKEVRGLFYRGAFSLVHVDAVPSHANIIDTRIITRLKHFGTIDEEAKSRLIIHGCQGDENNRIVSNAPTVSHASIRSSSASLQSNTILYGLKMLLNHSHRARTRSRGICMQGYLLNYFPS
jgi:hypothetical protein